MNSLQVGLMTRGIRCSVKCYNFRSFTSKINVSSPMLTDDDRKSGLFARLKNIFGQSSANANYVKNQRPPNYINSPSRGVADHGSKNRKSSIDDSSGQKMKKNSSEKKEKKSMVKIDWGVKLPDEQVESEDDVDEHFPKYVLRQKWGVNLLEPMRHEQRRATNKNLISRFDDVMRLNKKITKSLPQTEMRVKTESSSTPIDTTVSSSILPTTLEPDQSLKSLHNDNFKHQMTEKLNMDDSVTLLINKNSDSRYDEEYNVSKEISCEDEIIAWQNVIVRTREHIKKIAEAGKVKPSEIELEEPRIKFSILPEPPRPKLDIAAVKTTELYHLIDSYMDPSEPPTAKGVRIALHQVNGKKM